MLTDKYTVELEIFKPYETSAYVIQFSWNWACTNQNTRVEKIARDLIFTFYVVQGNKITVNISGSMVGAMLVHVHHIEVI